MRSAARYFYCAIGGAVAGLGEIVGAAVCVGEAVIAGLTVCAGAAVGFAGLFLFVHAVRVNAIISVSRAAVRVFFRIFIPPLI